MEAILLKLAKMQFAINMRRAKLFLEIVLYPGFLRSFQKPFQTHFTWFIFCLPFSTPIKIDLKTDDRFEYKKVDNSNPRRQLGRERLQP